MIYLYRILLFVAMFLSTTTTASSSEEVLINGVPVSPDEYPEVVRIRSCESGRGCASCSASVIGEKVVLTAGHCLVGDGESDIEYMIGQTQYKAKCTPHPLYPAIEDMDMALCVSDKPMDLKYAHVSQKGPAVGDDVTLIGYGCINSQGGGGNDGILRVGRSNVYRLPRINPVDNWFWTQDDSALCFGDSGGPAFKLVENPKIETHYVMGVNSRGDIRSISLLTAIYLDKGLSFMSAFESEKGVKICGISADCDDSIPEDPEEIPPECERLKRRTDRIKRRLEFFEERYNQCLIENS